VNRPKARVLAAALAGLAAAAGCDQAAWLGHHLLKPIMPPEKVEAQYDLTGKSLLVLVDVHDPELGGDFPRLQARLGDAVAKVLTDNEACGPIVPAYDLDAARRQEPEFPNWSVVKIGRYFNTDLVLHLVVYEFRVRDHPGSSVLDGFAEGTIRLVSPETGKQEWPVLAAARQVSARTLPDIEPVEDPLELERILTRGFGDKIARHFFTYNVDDLPLRPKVE
jgi:hypothetical protein